MDCMVFRTMPLERWRGRTAAVTPVPSSKSSCQGLAAKNFSAVRRNVLCLPRWQHRSRRRRKQVHRKKRWTEQRRVGPQLEWCWRRAEMARLISNMRRSGLRSIPCKWTTMRAKESDANKSTRSSSSSAGSRLGSTGSSRKCKTVLLIREGGQRVLSPQASVKRQMSRLCPTHASHRRRTQRVMGAPQARALTAVGPHPPRLPRRRERPPCRPMVRQSM